MLAYLIGLMSGSGGSLALVTRRELSQISVVVAFPKKTASGDECKMLGHAYIL